MKKGGKRIWLGRMMVIGLIQDSITKRHLGTYRQQMVKAPFSVLFYKVSESGQGVGKFQKTRAKQGGSIYLLLCARGRGYPKVYKTS